MTDDPTGTPDTSTDTGRTFTQADLDRIGAREKAQGRKAAEQALSEQLGVPVTEAAQIIKAHRDRTEADKSEIQRAAEARQQAEQDAATARAEAAQIRHTAAVERALLTAGVALPEDGADETLAGVAGLVAAEPGADAATINAAVATLKGRLPGLFGRAAAAGGAAGDPGPGPRGGQSAGKGGIAAGLARAQEAAAGRPGAMRLEGTRPVFDYTRK